MKPRPTKHRRERKKQQHRIQQNKPRNRSIGVLKQHHHGHKPDRRPTKVQLSRRVVCQRYAESAERRVEEPHESVVDILGVFFAGLEFKGAIVAGEVAGETNKHFSEGWVHVEVEFAFEVVGAEFAEADRVVSGKVSRCLGDGDARLLEIGEMRDILSFIPCHYV